MDRFRPFNTSAISKSQAGIRFATTVYGLTPSYAPLHSNLGQVIITKHVKRLNHCKLIIALLMYDDRRHYIS